MNAEDEMDVEMGNDTSIPSQSHHERIRLHMDDGDGKDQNAIGNKNAMNGTAAFPSSSSASAVNLARSALSQSASSHIDRTDNSYMDDEDEDDHIPLNSFAAAFSPPPIPASSLSLSPDAPLASPVPAPAPAPPPVKTSRSGRRVVQPQLFNPAAAAGPQALASSPSSAAAASSAESSSGRATSATKHATKSTTKPATKSATKAAARSNKKKGGGGSSSKSKANGKRSRSKTHVDHEEEEEDDDGQYGYKGEGYSVRDHSWYCFNPTKYASPPISDELMELHKPVTCEDACSQVGIECTREMRVELRQDTINALKRCMQNEKGEKSRSVLEMCDTGLARNCALFQTDPSDPNSIRMLTTRWVSDRSVLGIYMGTLRERTTFEAMYGSRTEANCHSYEIAPKDLPPSYHGETLILETNTHANEARFIRDARWDDLEISANVQCRVVWNAAKCLPYIALVALCDIDRHSEVFIDWGELAWGAHARSRLHRYATLSHQLHIRLKQFQDILGEKGVEPYASREVVGLEEDIPFEDWHQTRPREEARDEAHTSVVQEKKRKREEEEEGKGGEEKMESAAALSTNDVAMDIGIRQPEVNDDSHSPASPSTSMLESAPTSFSSGAAGASSSSLVLPRHRRLHAAMSRTVPAPSHRHGPGHRPTFILRNTVAVFDNVGVKLMNECDYSPVDPDAMQLIKAIAPKPGPLKPALQTVFETGRCPKAAVYEVVSLRHPARFYTAPDCPTYALLARESINAKEPIGVYVGKVHIAQTFHESCSSNEDRIKQVYTYGMQEELFPPGYNGPGLVCESLSIGGNETRYVNDCWNRRGGGESANAEAMLMWDPLHGNLPVMVIFARRNIAKGEEIVTDYGTTFWNKISPALVTEHQNYQSMVQVQLDKTERLVRQTLRKEMAAQRGVEEESIDLDSIELPPQPHRMEHFRRLYNQHDVLYEHTRAPVRADMAGKHRDDFARNMYERSMKQAADTAAKERERAARAARMAALAKERARERAEKAAAGVKGTSRQKALRMRDAAKKAQECIAETLQPALAQASSKLLAHTAGRPMTLSNYGQADSTQRKENGRHVVAGDRATSSTHASRASPTPSTSSSPSPSPSPSPSLSDSGVCSVCGGYGRIRSFVRDPLSGVVTSRTCRGCFKWRKGEWERWQETKEQWEKKYGEGAIPIRPKEKEKGKSVDGVESVEREEARRYWAAYDAVFTHHSAGSASSQLSPSSPSPPPTTPSIPLQFTSSAPTTSLSNSPSTARACPTATDTTTTNNNPPSTVVNSIAHGNVRMNADADADANGHGYGPDMGMEMSTVMDMDIDGPPGPSSDSLFASACAVSTSSHLQQVKIALHRDGVAPARQMQTVLDVSVPSSHVDTLSASITISTSAASAVLPSSETLPSAAAVAPLTDSASAEHNDSDERDRRKRKTRAEIMLESTQTSESGGKLNAANGTDTVNDTTAATETALTQAAKRACIASDSEQLHTHADSESNDGVSDQSHCNLS